jgi:hypothetical protein
MQKSHSERFQVDKKALPQTTRASSRIVINLSMFDKQKDGLNGTIEEPSKPDKDLDTHNDSRINGNRKSMNTMLEVNSTLHSSSLCDLKSMVGNKLRSKNNNSFIEIN